MTAFFQAIEDRLEKKYAGTARFCGSPSINSTKSISGRPSATQTSGVI
jgi:hypothetical protein